MEKVKSTQFVRKNKKGDQKILEKELKDAIVSTKKIVSDGKCIYYFKDDRLLEKLSFEGNRKIRKYLFEENAQSVISYQLMERIISDLIVDTRIELNDTILNPERYINLVNGIFDLQEKSFYSNEESEVDKKFTYVIDAKYLKAEERKMPKFEEFLVKSLGSKMNEDESIYLLESIGFLLSSVNTLRKVVIFIGAMGSGKSTLARFIASLVQPSTEVSYVTFQELNQKFKLFDVVNAKLNVGDEMNKGTMRNLAQFKAITSGEYITVEQKGRDPVKVKANVRQLYTTNHLPQFDDGNAAAVYDRLNIINFPNTISLEDRDLNLYYELLEERDSIVSAALDYFAIVFSDKNGVFTEPSKIKKSKAICLDDDLSIERFLKNLKFDENSVGISSRELFERYCSFCHENAFRRKNKTELKERIIQIFSKYGVEYKKKRISKTKNVWSYTCLKYQEDDSNE